MDSKRLKRKVYEVIISNKLFGLDEQLIVEKVFKTLGSGDTRNKIRTAINELVEAGTIARKKEKGPAVIVNPKVEDKGTFILISHKFGGKIITNNGRELIVKPGSFNQAKTGDVVSYVLEIDGRATVTNVERSNGKTSAGIKVAETKKIAGLVCLNENKEAQFIANDRKAYPNPFVILNDRKSEMVQKAFGSVVIAEVSNFAGGEDTVKITKVYGKVGDPLPEINAIAEEAGIEMELSERALNELDRIPEELDLTQFNLVDEKGKSTTGSYDINKNDYVDLRNKAFATIDPFDCRDMDDAVYTELDEDGNFITYAAIADVTEYIKPGMELWDKALAQGFTLYTPAGSFPMLPEKLSNGICSLNPNVDRLTLCVKSVIDKETGKRIPEKSEVLHAVINSRKKFSYNEVQEMLDTNDYNKIYADITTRVTKGEVVEPNTLLEQVVLNKVCSDKIWKNFQSRDLLRFNNNEEVQFTMSEDKTQVLDIEEKVHLKSMELIEALMINANENVAEYTNGNKMNSLYRIHDKPDESKLGRLTEFLDILDVKYDGQPTNNSFQKVLDSVKGTDIAESVNDMVLRTQSKAKYGNKSYIEDGEFHDENEIRICHNALQSENYTHFTSGIRRVSDLVVQYALKQKLRGGKPAFSEEYVAQVGPIISSSEIRIEDAERKIDDMCVAIWAENHMNEIFDGKVRAFNGQNVIVENQKKLRVEIPLADFVKGEVKISDAGVAAFDKSGNAVIKLGDKTSFKICGADRINGIVYGSCNLEKNFTTNPFAYNPNETVAKRENPLKNQMQQWANSTVKGDGNATKVQEELERKESKRIKMSSMEKIKAEKAEALAKQEEKRIAIEEKKLAQLAEQLNSKK